MKTLYAFITVIFTLLTQTACAQQPIFKDLPAGNGVEKVFIGKELLRLSDYEQFGINTPGVNIIDLNGIDSVEVISISTTTLWSTACEILSEYVNKAGLKILMQSQSEDGERIIYGRTTSDSNQIDNMIIFYRDSEEMQIVILSGNISPETQFGL